MHYFAGLFDAEGYISLCPNGAFAVAIEMTNEEIPILFKELFKGHIYERKREKRKKSYIWKINSICEDTLFFINSIKDYSIIKTNQLNRLYDYLNISRDERKSIRAITCSSIKNFKQPSPLKLTDILPRIQKPIEPHFFEWFAGFIDGDGNFVCNEYTDNRNQKKYFARQLSIANIFLEPICHINDRVQGCISNLNRAKNHLYKWTCKREHEQFVCKNIHPFLRIKKSQCELFMEFLTFPQKMKKIPYSTKDYKRMYEIINQIKHLNSF